MRDTMLYFCHSCNKNVYVDGFMTCLECSDGFVEVYDPLKHAIFDDSMESILIILEELRNLNLPELRIRNLPQSSRQGMRSSSIASDIRNYVPDEAIDEVLAELMETNENNNTRPFSDVKKLKTRLAKKENMCSICLSTYKVGERILQFSCRHTFHRKCAVTWLKMQNTCPNCRLLLG